MPNIRHTPLQCLLKMQPPAEIVEGRFLHSCIECKKEAFGPNVLHVCSGEEVVPEKDWVRKYKVFNGRNNA